MKGPALVVFAAFALLVPARAHAACELDMSYARDVSTAAAFVEAAYRFETAGQLSKAFACLERARELASPAESSDIDAGLARLRATLTSPGAVQAGFEQALLALKAADRRDLETARKLASVARDLAQTQQQIDDVVSAADALLKGVPKFALDATFQTSILGFIGSGSSFTRDQFFNTKNALDYSVQPIILGGLSARARLLEPSGWEWLGFRLGYQTDRIFGSGGQIARTTLAQQLGVTGITADVVDGALGFLGVGFEGEYATFTNGRVKRIDVLSNTPQEEAPLRFTRTRLEGTFNLTPHLWKVSDPQNENQRSQVILHALYYHVAIPRIAYLTQRDPATNATIVVAESEPQTIDVAFGAAGASGRLATGNDHVSAGVFLTLMLGGGPVSFTMPARLVEPAGPNNRVRLQESTLAVVSRAGIYGDWRIAGDTYAAYLGASLSGEQYYARAQVPGSVAGSVGFADAFYTALITTTFRYRYLPGH